MEIPALTTEMILVFGIVLGTLVLFVSEILRIDVVAFLIMVVLILTGLVSPEQGVSGFSHPATITVMAMLILSLGLENTGFVNALGKNIIRISGKGEKRILLTLMLSVGLISGFINNTAAVAVFLPVTLRIARINNISPSRLLMPLSFAAILGGTCTLIGTSTNILVSTIADKHGIEGFHMFEFSKAGIIFLGIGMLYMLLFGARLLPVRRGAESLSEGYQLRSYLTEILVPMGSKLAGKSIRETKIKEEYNFDVLQLVRGETIMDLPPDYTTLLQDDVLIVRGKIDEILRIQAKDGWMIKANTLASTEKIAQHEKLLMEAVITPASNLIGKTVKSVDFRNRYGGVCVACRRDGHSLNQRLSLVEFKLGDSILIECTKDRIQTLRETGDFILLNEIEKEPFKKNKLRLSVGIVAGVVLAAAMGWLPVMSAALLGCLAMFLTKCLNIRKVYQRMEWQVIFLLAGVLPLGLAIENSGADMYLAGHMLDFIGVDKPWLIILGLVFVTMLMTELISNNASAILLAPLALNMADSLQVNPKAFLLAVMFAASFSFVTPIGYQTNALIYGPGNYRYVDYIRAGGWLSLVLWGVATWLITLWWM